MVRPHTTFRTFAALLLLGVMAVVFVAMGNWQSHRASEREGIRLAIQQGRGNPPVQLDAHTPDGEFVDWRPATAHGTWLHDLTVLLDNRNYKGRPGYWVATPLLIDPASNTAILVLRGWMPRTLTLDQAVPMIPKPSGMQTVRGEMLHHVPRLFELWSFSKNTQAQLPATLPSVAAPLPSVQNLELSTYAAATGLNLLPIILEQNSVDSNGAAVALVQEWPEPSLDADQNKGYALQWFSFALIAAGAWVFIAWRAWRRRRTPQR